MFLIKIEKKSSQNFDSSENSVKVIFDRDTNFPIPLRLK